MSTSKAIVLKKSTEHETSQSNIHDISQIMEMFDTYQKKSSRASRGIINNNIKRSKFYSSETNGEVIVTHVDVVPNSILQLNNEINLIKNEIEKIREMLVQFYIASAKEGENMYEKEIMEKLEHTTEKLHSVEKSVAVIEEKIKKLDSIPTTSEIQNIISNTIDRKNLPSKSDVKLQVIKARNTQITWTIGTIIAAATIIIKFL